MNKFLMGAAAALMLPAVALAQPVAFISNGGAGTTTYVSSAAPLPVTVASQTGASATQVQGSSASGATDDGSNPVKVGCVFLTTLPAPTNGQRSNCQMDSDGSMRMSMAGVQTSGVAAQPKGAILPWQQGTARSLANAYPLGVMPFLYNGTNEDAAVTIAGALAAGSAGTGTTATEPSGALFNEITTATSTTVKASAGILHRVTVNTCVTSATIKVYNALSATGTPITITCPATVGNPFYIDYDMYFGTGIFVVTSGATDVTVGYR